MKNYSIWKDNNVRDGFVSKKIDTDMECDVLIVGGGLTGVSTYYHLKDSDSKVILVEQNKIGMGVTANSTGKLTYLQDSMYNKIIKKCGIDKAREYLNSQVDGMRLVVDIIKTNNIECDLVSSPSYVYTNKKSEIEDLIRLKEFLIDNGIEVVESDTKLVKNKYVLKVLDTYLFNPVKFIYGLLDKCDKDNIYEDSSVVDIKEDDDGYICYVNECKIRTKKVVIASHYPFFNIPYLFPIRGSLEKSYLCSGERKMDNVSLITYGKPVISIRNYKDNIILVGDSVNVNKIGSDKDRFKKVIDKSKFFNFDYKYLWSNIDIITNDSLPYIGLIKDNMYIGTGYNTWGMINGVMAGNVISDLINNKDNKYVELFDPKRKSKGKVFGITYDIYSSMKGYVNGVINKNSNIEYKNIDGDNVCVYKDSSGEHIVYKNCPHMGCEVIFNDIEKTWDCPCHGSRFNIDGKCISGPSNKDITYKSKS